MKKTKEKLVLDVTKIFTSLPKTTNEKFVLLIFLSISFAVYFGPLTMKNIDLIKAAMIVLVPTLTTGWGILVVYRFIFMKRTYSKKEQ